MKKILFTGARSGIAHATIKRLLNKDYLIYLTVHTDKQLELVRETYKNNENVICLKIDITNKEDLIKLEGLDIDILVSNASIGEGGSIVEIPMDKVRNNFEVNVFSNFEIIQKVFKQMIKKNNGRIIVMSSLIRLVPINFLGVYSATKASISNLMFTLNNELKYIDTNVRVVLIEPGPYHTGSNQVMLDNKYTWMSKDSYFSSCLEEIRRCENILFNLVEKNSLRSVARTIEKAVESESPRFLYQVPLSHAIGAKFFNFFFF
ncbi:MAG: SDR family NAD(P)-dependent oxidoreductase [Bacilli bacterium]|nr:SDR family NAD(P)-dependent oxidoreductase [Bacilli bacterium]